MAYHENQQNFADSHGILHISYFENFILQNEIFKIRDVQIML